MVRLAKTDGEYAAIEMTMIDHVLLKRFDLSKDAAQDLRKSAEELESKAPDTVRFTRVIKESVIYEERASVIEAL